MFDSSGSPSSATSSGSFQHLPVSAVRFWLTLNGSVTCTSPRCIPALLPTTPAGGNAHSSMKIQNIFTNTPVPIYLSLSHGTSQLPFEPVCPTVKSILPYNHEGSSAVAPRRRQSHDSVLRTGRRGTTPAPRKRGDAPHAQWCE